MNGSSENAISGQNLIGTPNIRSVWRRDSTNSTANLEKYYMIFWRKRARTTTNIVLSQVSSWIRRIPTLYANVWSTDLRNTSSSALKLHTQSLSPVLEGRMTDKDTKIINYTCNDQWIRAYETFQHAHIRYMGPSHMQYQSLLVDTNLVLSCLSAWFLPKATDTAYVTDPFSVVVYMFSSDSWNGTYNSDFCILQQHPPLFHTHLLTL